MPGPGITQDKENKVAVISLNDRRPRLWAHDRAKILADSGRQVTARISNLFRARQLILIAPLECDDDVFLAARQQAMEMIAFNNDNFPDFSKEPWKWEPAMCFGDEFVHTGAALEAID